MYEKRVFYFYFHSLPHSSCDIVETTITWEWRDVLRGRLSFVQWGGVESKISGDTLCPSSDKMSAWLSLDNRSSTSSIKKVMAIDASRSKPNPPLVGHRAPHQVGPWSYLRLTWLTRKELRPWIAPHYLWKSWILDDIVHHQGASSSLEIPSHSCSSEETQRYPLTSLTPTQKCRASIWLIHYCRRSSSYSLGENVLTTCDVTLPLIEYIIEAVQVHKRAVLSGPDFTNVWVRLAWRQLWVRVAPHLRWRERDIWLIPIMASSSR